MSVLAHHPGTGAYLAVTEEQLDHMRASGWLLAAEHQQNQADAQAAAEAAAAPKKTSKSDEGK